LEKRELAARALDAANPALAPNTRENGTESNVALPPPLVAEIPLSEQSARRRELAEKLDALARHGQPRLVGLVLDGAKLSALRARRSELPEATTLDIPPDRELALSLGPAAPALGEINRRIVSLDTWDSLAGALRRLFA